MDRGSGASECPPGTACPESRRGAILNPQPSDVRTPFAPARPGLFERTRAGADRR